MSKAKFLYRYDGQRINDGWVHPVTGVEYKRQNWFDSQTPEKLDVIGVTRHDWPVPPKYDAYYQKPVEQPSGEYVIEDLPLDNVKTRKKAELLAAYENKMLAVTKGYSRSEIASWDKQEAEAKDWHKWKTTLPLPPTEPATPFIDGLVVSRGMDKQLLVTKILEKAVSATQYTALQTGTKQALEDAVDACETGAAVQSVVWPE